jgi:hypothetical protein
MPKLDEDNFAFSNNADAEKAFRIRFNFAIYNTEEVLGTNPGEKFKKLYFWDMHNELLREKNSYYSTANFVNNQDIINCSNAFHRPKITSWYIFSIRMFHMTYINVGR